MKMVIVALKDTAIQAFLAPQAVVHRNSMIRALQDQLKKKDSEAQWVKHPEDFELYYIGEYDDADGSIVPPQSPQLIVRLKDLVAG